MLWFDIPDELLPPAYQAIKDMYAGTRTLDTELRDFLTTMYYIRRNFFVRTCDTPTVDEWISLLAIPLYGGETLEDKRNLILLYLNNQKPATEPYFRSMMDKLFGEGGYTLEIDPDDPLKVNIEFIERDPLQIQQFGDWFIRMVPAHILWYATLIRYSRSKVVSTSNAIVAEKMRSSASMSNSAEPDTIYLGQDSFLADWIEV